MALAWKPNPNSRRLMLEVRPGDPKPKDPFTGEWWSGWFGEVEWIEKGVWEWRVWAPQRHASGQALDWGDAPAAAQARQKAAARLLEAMTDATPSEREQLAQLAETAVLAAVEPKVGPLDPFTEVTYDEHQAARGRPPA